MKLLKLLQSNISEIYSASAAIVLPLFFVQDGICAGFPSPADDFLDISIDLNKELIQHPSSTFYARVDGNSMIGAGISDGDLLIIDRSVEPRDGKIAVCCINGEFTIKRLQIKHNGCWLLSANKHYQPIKVTKSDVFLVWGMVIHVIKHL